MQLKFGKNNVPLFRGGLYRFKSLAGNDCTCEFIVTDINYNRVDYLYTKKSGENSLISYNGVDKTTWNHITLVPISLFKSYYEKVL